MIKVLIFGATGFIGTNIKLQLSKDKSFRVFAPKSSECDLQKLNQVERFINKNKPEIIINSAFSGVSANIPFSSEYIFKNSQMVVNILEACRDKRYIKKIIHLGSGAEYGDSDQKIREDFPTNPKNIHGTAKAVQTLLAQELAREYSLPLIILRSFYLIGPHDENTIPTRLIKMIKNNEEIVLTRGEQKRDYMYVGDLVEIIAYISRYPKKFQNNEIYNTGSGQGIRLKDLFKIIFGEFNMTFEKKFREYSPNEYFNQVADTSKLKKVMKNIKITPLDDAVEETIRWNLQQK